MRGLAYNPGILPAEMIIRQRVKPMPSREELLKRKSFGSYAAPPVPVVPAALPENDDEDGHDIDCLEPSEVYALGRTAGWNACRAAMLHDKSEQPQNAQQNIPENIPGGNSPVTPDGWIQVRERMPEPYEYVLVTDGFDGCEVMRVNADGYWGPAKSLYPGSITHWMPLPAAPQQEVK